MNADPAGSTVTSEIPVAAPPANPSPSIANQETISSSSALWANIAAGVLIIAHFCFIMHYSEPAITTPDANGYWAQGTLLYQTGKTYFRQESDVQYVGMHWLLTDDGRYFSRYPPGMAVIIAGAYAIGGAHVSAWVDPIIAMLTLAGFFLLLRHFLPPWMSVGGLLLMAINPVFNQHALFQYAHMAVACLLVWGLWLLLRWGQSGKLRDIFFAAMIMACIPSVRYPEIIFGVGCLVFVLWELNSKPRRVMQIGAAVLGAAIPLTPLLIYHYYSFGAATTTAYVLTNEQTGFGWDYFQQHFTPYIRALLADGAGLLFPFGIVGLGAMCALPATRRRGVLLTLVAVPSAILYMAYYWGMGLANTGGGGMGGTGGGNIRYLMPTLLCYVLAGVWFLHTLTQQQPKAMRWSAMGVLALFQFFWGGWTVLPELRQLQHQKKILAVTADRLEELTHADDVVIADNQIQQDLDYYHRWRLADSGLLQGRARGFGGRSMDGDADQPSPRQQRKAELFEAKYGMLSAAERELALAMELQDWAGSSSVYYVGPESQLANMGQDQFNEDRFKIIARIELPPAPPEESRMGMMGRGPGPGGQQGGPGGVRRGRGGSGWGGGPGGPPGGGGGMRFRIDEKEFVVARWTSPAAAK